MPALADRHFPIRAGGSADSENLRELPGSRHQQDAEHDQHLQKHGGADALASRLLRRDGHQHQPAPTSRRNVSEAKHPHAGRRFKEIVHEIRTVGPMQDKCYANAFVYVQDSNRTDLHIAIGATRWTKAGGEFLASDMWEFGNPKQWKGVHW